MKVDPITAEKNMVRNLIDWIVEQEAPPLAEDVENVAGEFAEIFDYNIDVSAAVKEAMTQADTSMNMGVSLVGDEVPHDEDWVSKRENINWIYSEAYEEHLKIEGWSPFVLQSLSDVAEKILGHLQDPDSEGEWNRRGMVIGHVQSGKTANYMGVIAKAADAGYKFIIVIAGIHNNLRKQTQERIDAGFVGRSSDPMNRREKIGVGALNHLKFEFPHPVTLTNINDDFNKQTAAQSGWKIDDFTKPIILVIKKNVRTLDALHRWLKDMNAQGDGRISDVPMLMIDDEADHASINTNDTDQDPTRTNAMIRKVLALFSKSCYVGYTATPFANIFIDPESYGDQEVRDELFPRDFIYSLEPPSSYFGPEQVFLDDETSDMILRPINDGEDYLPLRHRKEIEVSNLPPSLHRAIYLFVIATAIRFLRGHENKHSSMMVNVSRFVRVQKEVYDWINFRLKKIREAVVANYRMPEAVASRNEFMRALKESFEAEYATSEVTWDQVKETLYSVMERLRTYMVNSRADEPLDYKRYENEGLITLAVGGLSLSRGLTIEGLCVSYMYRNTRMYDTLMQMGRWFGYRSDYEDLCRIYLSEDSINWYAHIAEASEELRQQIRDMRLTNRTPKQFGLYVNAHPDSLLITAPNKMRRGESVIFKQNFSEKLVESHALPTDKKINQKNEKLIEEFWQTGFGIGEQAVEKTQKGWIVKNVPVGEIEDFLMKFESHVQIDVKKMHVIDYLRQISENYPLGDVLLISLNNHKSNAIPYHLGPQIRTRRKPYGDTWQLSKGRVASRGDEKLGLNDRQIKEAETIARKADKKPSDIHYRQVRGKPLLMIHVLEPHSEDSAERLRVPAFGISFPRVDYETAIEVVVNRVMLEQMRLDFSDDEQGAGDDE